MSLYNVDDFKAQNVRRLGQFGKSTSSAACWGLAAQWLEDCRTKHKDCQLTDNVHPYAPTRLIEIEHTVRSYQLRLSLNQSAISKMEYVTLSHRWGTSPSLTLTRLKVDPWSRNIPFGDLPQTFQDAVVATHQLGFKYLWIDALCIIQDYKEDWYHEASTMSDVYRNSQCNLSALDARNDSDGMFSSRQSDLNIPVMVDSPAEKGPDRLFCLEPSSYWDNQVTQKALNRRAWVIQERILAPRILHFNRSQLLWECCELCACETFPDGISPSRLQPECLNLTAQISSLQHESDEEQLPNWKLESLWRALLPLYTACDLTISSDKLLAISGVAKYLGAAFRADYCAGLWKYRFTHQLLWRVLNGNGTRPESYRAPSWSWASLDGKVVWAVYPLDSVKCASLECVEASPVTDDAFGAITHGIVRLRGRLYPAATNYQDLAFETETHGFIGSKGGNATWQDTIHESSMAGNLCCVPISISSSEEVEQFGCWDFSSLILRPSNRIHGAFERWGYRQTVCYLEETESCVFGYWWDGKDLQREDDDRYPEQIITIV